jgi:putative ABC transport system permease protein
MLSNDFVKLVVVSIFLGTPLAYYLAVQWLQQYDYHVELSWMVFALTDLLAVVITLLTVSYQALKAAYMNPVNSLRTE